MHAQLAGHAYLMRLNFGLSLHIFPYFVLKVEARLCRCTCFYLIWIFKSHQQTFRYVGTGLPGLNQYKARINVSCSKTTTQWHWWGSNPQPLGLESRTLPLSHYAPQMHMLTWAFLINLISTNISCTGFIWSQIIFYNTYRQWYEAFEPSHLISNTVAFWQV